MDSHKRSAQLERLEVVATGRRRRWSEDEKLKIVLESLQTSASGIIDRETVRHIALVVDQMATIIPTGAARS
jgi:transposase-like protein